MSDEVHPTDDPGLTGADLPPIDPALASWLAQDPAPPMPADVWDRISAALAAEPPFVAMTGAPAEAVAPTGQVTDLAEARARRSGRLWPVLAGAAGIALVGLVALPAIRGGGAPPVADGPVTASAAIDVPTPNSDEGQGGNEPLVAEAPAPEDPAVAATAAPTAEAVSTATPNPAEPTASPSPTVSTAVATPVAMLDTGTTYSIDLLPTQVGTVLATAGLPDSTSMARAMGRASTASAPAMTGDGMLASPQALHDCLLRLGLPETSLPLVVDHGSFDGHDAGMIITVGKTQVDGKPSDLHVVLVGTACAESDVAAARHFDLPITP